MAAVAQLANFRLKVFRTVAENLSFRRAGEELYLTQPAVTLQIKALEEDLGVPLFDRTGRQIALTPAGTVLLECVGEIDRLLTAAEQEIAGLRGEVAGELRIGVSTTIAQYVLPRMLGEFHKKNPQVRLMVESGNTEEIVNALREKHIALGLIEGPARRGNVREEPFLEDELVLLVPASHEWAGSGPIQVAQLADAPLLIREQGSGSRRVIEQALEKAGVKLKSLKIALELDSTEAIKSAVEAGLGVGFASRWATYKEAEMGTLHEVEIQGLRILRMFTLLYPSGPEPNGAAGAFRRFALERRKLLLPRVAKNQVGRKKGPDRHKPV
jgi:LysR family transcriptional regulator, transcriptional activator of the cysJI operon